MKKTNIIFYIFFFFILGSCTDDIHLNNHKQYEQKLVVYAFPTVKDTFDIIVSATHSLQSQGEILEIEYVHCKCNKQEDKIIFSHKKSVNDIPLYVFKAIGKHDKKDTIQIDILAKGYPQVHASTSIPTCTKIENYSLDSIFYDGSLHAQSSIMFHAPKEQPFYAVSAQCKYAKHDESIEYTDLETALDPILRQTKKTSFNLSGTDNCYQKMYYFQLPTERNTSFTTLRPCILSKYESESYLMTLYTLSPEYYYMLKSLANQENNDLADFGLSFIYSTYTNIHNGYGCVAAYNADSTPWLPFK